MRTALHECTEGQLSKTHGEPRELIALHAHVATVRDEILTASSCGNDASLSAEGKRSLQWTHTTHFCCLQTFPDSTQKSEERRRERQKQADEMTKHPCLFVFFTPHSYFKRKHRLLTESIPRLTWLYNVVRMLCVPFLVPKYKLFLPHAR